ncbi:hypothetical protein XM82_004822 [Salmonella enterica subsp. enterica serovar Haifa]|nr:hypothetical protein [Salmonella enterica subsp. enterica serovar Haifa]
MNPLIPSALDVLLSAAVVAAWIFAMIALVSALRSRDVTGARFLVWVLAIAFLPVVGAAVWFLTGRQRKIPSPTD